MKRSMPMFGVSSGLATAMGYFPHILFLAVVAITQSRSIPSVFLIFTFTARILGELTFWLQLFPSRLESNEIKPDWRSSIKSILLSNSASQGAICEIIGDLGIDALLVFLALKASASSVLIFLVFSSCQAIGALGYGVMIYLFSRKRLRLFFILIDALAVFAALEISGLIPMTSHLDIFGLYALEKPTAALLIIGVKCLFSGTTVIAKTTIAETIQLETIKELTK